MKKVGNIFILVLIVAVAWWFVRRVLRPILRFATNIVLTVIVVIAVLFVIAILRKKGNKF
ncbi:MAG: hypothetical protein FWD48_07725 [Oscillospiraceae bacterium]|nr:hypothetical protein [Oscillospiraceae bacterium]